MKHRSPTRRLSRDKDHRRALLRNLASSLIEHGKIKTTLTKAKFVKAYVEKLVTRAKIKNQNNMKLVQKEIHSNVILHKLFDEVSPNFAERAGGYTRISRLGLRDGDKAEMVELAFVESEAKTPKTDSVKKETKAKKVKVAEESSNE